MNLTEKDIQMLNLLIEGKIHKEIAEVMNVTSDAIDRRLERLRIKNDCITTIQLTARYLLGKPNTFEHTTNCTLVHANSGT